MPSLLILARSLGKWRYFLTGLPLAVLFGLVCRAFGQIASLLGERCVFRGECESVQHRGDGTVLCVRFQDAARLSHSAAFISRSPDAVSLHEGDAVAVAMRRAVFSAGSYAQSPADARDNGDILLRREYRRQLRRSLLRTLLVNLLICGAALAVFLIAMHFCFP